MKKFLVILFTLTLCLSISSLEQTKVEANSTKVGELISTTTEYLEDGSYIVKELYIVESNYNARSTEYTKEHHLAVIQYSASDKVLWTYDLYGTFTIVEGVSCVATASSYETTINNSTWHFSNGSSRCVDCYVYGAGTFKHKILGITTKTINIDVRIECDEYGNITA